MFIAVILMYAGNPTCWGQNIPWRIDYLLTWGDFNGQPDNTSDFYAKTFCDYSYLTKRGRNDSLQVVVNCTFNKSRSWKKGDKALTSHLLLHEQLHFWIAELYTRKMRQEFEAYGSSHQFSKCNNSDLKTIFYRLDKECETYEELYDKETDHSKNAGKQEEWRKRIVKEVLDLNAYQAK